MTDLFELSVGEIIGNCGDGERMVFSPGLLYNIGNSWLNMFRTILIPGATLAAIPLAADTKCIKQCKPSELPVYGSINNCECGGCAKAPLVKSTQTEIGALEKGIQTVRIGISGLYEKFVSQKDFIEMKVDETKNSAKFAVLFLREQKNEPHRYAAIGLGGLAGIILGIRGGKFKKFIYMSAGAASMAAICYPEKAEIVAKDGFAASKQYAKIGYNFINGVKPGDEPAPLPSLPKIPVPSSFSEILDSVTNFAKSAKDTLMPAKSEGEKKV